MSSRIIQAFVLCCLQRISTGVWHCNPEQTPLADGRDNPLFQEKNLHFNWSWKTICISTYSAFIKRQLVYFSCNMFSASKPVYCVNIYT